MRKLFLLCLLFFGVLIVAACDRNDEEEVDTDEEDVQAAKDELALPDMDEVLLDFWVKTAGPYGTTISWESDTPDHIEVTDDTRNGEVRMAVTPVDPGEDTVWVRLTATITKGEATATKDFDVEVVEIIDPAHFKDTIAEVWDVEHREPVGVEGVVTNITSHRNIFIEDETGGLSVFDYDEMIVPDLNIGDRLQVVGERDEFRGLRQISFLTWFSITETGVDLPAPANLDEVDIEDPDAMLAYQSRRVEISGMVVEEDPGDFAPWGTILLSRQADGKEIELYYDSRLGCDDVDDFVKSLSEGDIINVTGLTVGWYDAPQLLIGATDQIEIVD